MTIKDIGKKLRAARVHQGLKAEAVAHDIGLSSVQTLYGYEQGRRSPDLATMSRLCQALGVTPNQMLGFSDFDRDLFVEVVKSVDDFQASHKRKPNQDVRIGMYFAVYDLVATLPDPARDEAGNLDLTVMAGLMRMAL